MFKPNLCAGLQCTYMYYTVYVLYRSIAFIRVRMYMHTCAYSGTSLLQTRLEREVSLIQRLFSTLLYLAGTTGSVVS